MSRPLFPRFLRRSRAAAGFSVVASLTAALTTLHGQQPAPAQPTPPPAAPVTAAAPGTPAVSFITSHATVWLGRSMIVPFRLAQATGSDQTFSANLADASAVEIVRPPTVLSGETTGFVRVRGLRVGRTRLTVHGDATLDLEIKTDPAAAVFTPIDAESGRPRIVSPVPDAAVWGQFAVGVEVFDANFHAALAPDAPTPRPAAAPNASPNASATPAPTATPSPTVAPSNTIARGGLKVQLRLPGGRLLEPVAATGPEVGPQRHYLFTVRAEDFPVGPLSMVAVASPDGGSFVDRQSGRAGGVQESAPFTVRVLRPQPGAFWTGECEAPAIMGETKELLAPARPAAVHYSSRVPDVGADPNASGGKTVLCPGGNDAWCLPFVVRNPGDFQLFIQARGDFGGGTFPSMALYRDASENPVGAVRLAASRYHRLPVGAPVHLDAGPQVLSVVFRNDFNHGKEDRNLFLDRFEIARVGDSATPTPAPGKGQQQQQASARPTPAPASPILDSPPPPAVANNTPAATPDAATLRVSILYPAPNASVHGADAVVARVSGAVGAARPAWVDLVIDGQPQGTRLLGPAAASDTLEFPLLARQLAPGSHRLAVRALDPAGHATDSPAVAFQVLDHPPFMPGPYERAVFLLDRLAFGPEPRELAAVLTLGESAWLNNRLASSYETPAEQAVLRAACLKYNRIDDEHQTSVRALAQWIGSDNPVRSRFTAWTENHFSTWVNKTKGAPKWHEHLNFCWMGVAPFGDLLSVSAHSPAMLAYLDQEKSYAGKLNENYAREIMELHTLGVHGGYKQTDVTSLAGVLNGWTTTNEAILPQVDEPLHLVYNGGNEAGVWRDFRFDPFLNDGKEREVFGMKYPTSKDPAVRYDNIRLAMEFLAAHPSTAEHVCRKLAEHYVGVPASDTLVRSLAQTYLENGGDMRAVMRAMVVHKDFWSAPMKMATPFDFGMRVARECRAAVVQLGADPNQAPNADQIENFLKKSGMGLFDRVTPDGYPENNGNYADSNALLQRWRFMQTIGESLNRLVPPNWRTPPATITPAANEVSADRPAGPPVIGDPLQRFIDLAAVRLTGHLLDNGSNNAALEVLGQGSADQMRETILFIALLPETSLR